MIKIAIICNSESALKLTIANGISHSIAYKRIQQTRKKPDTGLIFKQKRVQQFGIIIKK